MKLNEHNGNTTYYKCVCVCERGWCGDYFLRRQSSMLGGEKVRCATPFGNQRNLVSIPWISSIFPRPGLPLGFLLFLKGIGWCGAGGRFPRDRPPVPPAPAARFPQNSIFAAQKHLGACFWGHKKPLREWGHAVHRFSSQKHSFRLQKNLGSCFLGHEKALAGMATRTP